MAKLEFSSGDFHADRRAEFAEMLAANGDAPAAGDLMADALTLAPSWAAGWFRLGEWREQSGRRVDAIAAYRSAAAADPQDRLGARLKLEWLGEGEAPPPSAFAETLFDQYADRFDVSLVQNLSYRAPQLLADALAASRALPSGRCLDLGCGTGLMGERLRPHVDWLEGVDISAGMLRKAEAKRIYDRLLKCDVAEGGFGDGFDLLTAADVAMYLGALDRFFSACAMAITSDGVLAFSVERNCDPATFALKESRRYAHGADYLRLRLSAAGFSVVSMESATIRLDRDAPVDGLIVVARRT